MPQTADRWTADLVRALPDDGKRYEVIDGELLVTPSPTRVHQRAVLELATLLGAFVQREHMGEAIISPADVELDPNGMVQPDVYVEGLIDGHLASAWNSGAPLLLVVEVLSPGTARVDRTVKRKRFQRAGIPEYWIVDTDGGLIERWRPGDDRPEILAESISWHCIPGRPALTIDLAAFFARVNGE